MQELVSRFNATLHSEDGENLIIVASTTETDSYGTRATKTFYKNVIQRAARGLAGIPRWLRDYVVNEVWQGGLPIVVPSHLFPLREDGVLAYAIQMRIENIVEEQPVLGDADALVVEAVPNESSPLWERFKERLMTSKLGASIAFVDLKHIHENGEVFERKNPSDVCPLCEKGNKKEFLDGVLLHVGMTMSPATPGTAVALRSADPENLIVHDASLVLGMEAEEIVKMIEEGVFSVSPGFNLRTDDTQQELDDIVYSEEEEDQSVYEIVDTSEDEDWLYFDEDGEMDDEGTDSVETRAKRIMKKEPDGYHPASHYLVVEDPEKPSTWHLPVKDVDGNYDRRRAGAAYAALTVGFRGRKYKGPQKQEALRKLKRIYKEMGWELPDAATRISARMDAIAERAVSLEGELETLKGLLGGTVEGRFSSLAQEIQNLSTTIQTLQEELQALKRAMLSSTQRIAQQSVKVERKPQVENKDPLRAAADWLLNIQI